MVEEWISKTGKTFKAFHYNGTMLGTVHLLTFVGEMNYRRNPETDTKSIFCNAAQQWLPIYKGEWVAQMTYDDGKPTLVPLTDENIKAIGEPVHEV